MPYADLGVRREFQRQWAAKKRAEDPEWAEKEREATRRFRTKPESAERRRAYANARHANLTDEQREDWRKRSRETQRRRRQIRRWKDGAGYVAILRNDPCSYCGELRPIFIDHIQPAIQGGSDHWTNLTAACQSCNSSKNATPLLLWMLKQKHLSRRHRSRRFA